MSFWVKHKIKTNLKSINDNIRVANSLVKQNKGVYVDYVKSKYSIKQLPEISLKPLAQNIKQIMDIVSKIENDYFPKFEQNLTIALRGEKTKFGDVHEKHIYFNAHHSDIKSWIISTKNYYKNTFTAVERQKYLNKMFPNRKYISFTENDILSDLDNNHSYLQFEKNSYSMSVEKFANLPQDVLSAIVRVKEINKLQNNAIKNQNSIELKELKQELDNLTLLLNKANIDVNNVVQFKDEFVSDVLSESKKSKQK